MTLSNFNVILSSCAHMGLIDRAFSTFDNFNQYNIIPNADTFAFLLENMAVNFFYNDNTDVITDETVGVVTQGIESIIHQITLIDPSYLTDKYVLHELVRLYSVIDVEKAKKLVQRAYHTEPQGILKNTYLVLAAEYVNRGNIEDAKEILSFLKHNEHIAASLWNRIKTLEQRQRRS